ncbi:MAG: TrmJ/YjtD family RNA methyltransferase [Candidatus Latescibacteria bacterium]|nr:TrmJ/YjtD family RNA methyltransferase [Candidatus Latescibacterota bacterium]
MAGKAVRIVLVETAGPLNLGSVARVMKNFGQADLVLVNPQCEPAEEEARRMAVHAQDVLAAARIVGSLEEALTGCTRVVATTARQVQSPLPYNTAATALPWLAGGTGPAALVFGSEERGLSTAELQWAQCWMGLPADPGYPTLNLAQAVALCCYELFRQGQSPQPEGQPQPEASVETQEAYLDHMARVLLDIGYLYPHTQTKRMEKMRRMLQRMGPTAEELAMLRGVWSQMEWALGQSQGGKSD